MSLFDLLYLEDHQIAVVTDAVRLWCKENAYEIDSNEGRQAMTMAVSLVQITDMTEQRLIEELSRLRGVDCRSQKKANSTSAGEACARRTSSAGVVPRRHGNQSEASVLA